MPKLQKATITHPRDRHSPRHDRWKRSISQGMRRAAQRRRAAGLVTFQEASVKTFYPVGALKAQADAGELKTVRRGSRRYIPVSEIRRLRDEIRRLKAA